MLRSIISGHYWNAEFKLALYLAESIRVYIVQREHNFKMCDELRILFI